MYEAPFCSDKRAKPGYAKPVLAALLPFRYLPAQVGQAAPDRATGEHGEQGVRAWP